MFVGGLREREMDNQDVKTEKIRGGSQDRGEWQSLN